MHTDKHRFLMDRKWIFGAIGGVGALILASYTLFAVSAKRVLLLSEYMIFSSALLRAVPSSTGENWLLAVDMVREALAYPVSTHSAMIAEGRYEVPLPPYTVRHPKHEHFYITFATREQLNIYYTTTLPQLGWDYVEQLGSGYFLRNNTTQLLISQTYHLGTKISRLAVSISEIQPTQH
jgi:hypothetical protein